MYIEKVTTKGVQFKVLRKYLNKPIAMINYMEGTPLEVVFEDGDRLVHEKIVYSEWNKELLFVETTTRNWYFLNK